jgi:enoyl-CoA hydratase
MMTGRNVPAEEAVSIGIALEVCDDVLEAALGLAGRIARNAPLAVRRLKRAVADADTLLSPALATEAWLFAECFSDADQKEGMHAFLDRRRPTYQGA